MRNWIKQQLRRRGYDLHKFLPAVSPDAQLALALSVMRIDLVIDVGANTGQFGQLLREIGYRGRIRSFEPLGTAWQALCAAAAGDAGWSVAPRGAIGRENGTISINVAGNSASSSVLPMLDRHREAAPHSAYVGTEDVPIARLDEALANVPASDRLFVKIDTQGYEAAVLDGAPDTLNRAIGVQLELSLVPLYQGAPLMRDMLARMDAVGYDVWAIWPGFADPATGRLLQMDGIFVRRKAAPD